MLRLFFFFFVGTLLPCLNGKLTMIVVWGQPPIDSQHGAITQSGVSWEQCIRLCYQSGSCILAHQPNSDTCLNFDFDKIPSVTKSTSQAGYQVAFKVESQVTGDVCPVGSNPPTFNGTMAGGQLEVGKTMSYTVKLTGEQWTIGYWEGVLTTIPQNPPTTAVAIMTPKPTTPKPTTPKPTTPKPTTAKKTTAKKTTAKKTTPKPTTVKKTTIKLTTPKCSGVWGAWSYITSCSAKCGNCGVQVRLRKCATCECP